MNMASTIPDVELGMNAPLKWSDILMEGGFTTSEVARLLGRGTSEIRSWLSGKHPIIARDYDDLNGHHVMSFQALVEARAVSYFLENGVSRGALRETMKGLRSKGERHPLARDKSFVTDGFRLIEVEGDKLINLANDVYAHADLMRPALAGRVIFEHGRAATFFPDPATPLVRIDPRHAVGKPVVIDQGRIVAASALAATAEDEGVEEAADWYGVSSAAAAQALQFEQAHAVR